MNRRVALASGLILLGAIAFPPEVNAKPGDFELAQASTTCTFSNPIAGVLVSPTGQPNLLAAGDNIPGSQLGQITIDCTPKPNNNTTITVTVSQPTQTSGPIQNLTTVATVQVGANANPSNTLSMPVRSTPTTLRVGMRASTTDGSILPAGTYTFTVNLTATQS